MIERGPLPDILAIEELLPPTARRGMTSTAAQHRLAGLHGIIRAMARHGEDPGDRQRQCRRRAPALHPGAEPAATIAKRAVLATCGMLGWEAADNNCADALALWSYTAALINPVTALQTTPLFGPKGPRGRTLRAPVRRSQ